MVPPANLPEVCIRHGRQFHATSSDYELPNDEREFARLNDQFQAFKVILGSSYDAPLKELNSGQGPKDVLDVASGSGIWVVDVAREFPQARVVGIDISKPGFSSLNAPNNASFVIADVTKGLPFDDASFDVVQMRVAPSIYERAPVYKEIHRILRPGGIIQLVELSPPESRKGHLPPALDEIYHAVHKADQKRASLDGGEKPEIWSIASQIAPAIRGAPSMWANPHEKKISVPIGVWSSDEAGQEAGRLMKRQTVELYNGFRPYLIDVGGMTGDEVDEMISRLANELEDGSEWQLEAPYDIVWAVKA